MINGKIESLPTTNQTDIQLTMKVLATIDTTLLCGVLDFAGKKYLLDVNDFNNFVLAGKKFNFVNDYDVYPSHLYNYKRISLLEQIFVYNSANIKYTFKNNNPCDLRRSNVEIYHEYHDEILKQNYTILEYIQGHYITLGNDAFVLKNPMWKIRTSNNEEQILMYCEKNTLCVLSADSYLKILEFEKIHNHGKKLTFYKHQNGYIGCSNVSLFIHQIIMECRGNGKGTKNVSVDHIDRNPLNNTLTNLRIATRDEQEQNSKGIADGTKRARKHNAQALPEGLTQGMMHKYVVYYNECYNKEKDLYREFFKVEGHPKFNGSKVWTTSKSNKISWQDKLAHANKVVDDLVRDVYPNTEATEKLPPYYRIEEKMGKYQLIYDKRNDVSGIRHNMRMILPAEFNLDMEIENFKAKLAAKYPPIVDEIKN